MIKRFLIGVGFVLISTGGLRAQEAVEVNGGSAPDYEGIAGLVTDPTSEYYYPDLLRRYQLGDTTLTLRDFRLLYYGYPTQAGYRPLMESPYVDSLQRVFGRRTSPTAEHYRQVVRYAGYILRDEPFSLRDLNALAFAYQMLGESELAERQLVKMSGVLEAIRSTGDGLREQSPWYIVYMRDAQDVLSLMGLSSSRMVIVSRTVGYAALSNAQGRRQKGYYFDYSEAYRRKPDYLDELKQERRLEFNSRYNPRSKQYTLPR